MRNNIDKIGYMMRLKDKYETLAELFKTDTLLKKSKIRTTGLGVGFLGLLANLACPFFFNVQGGFMAGAMSGGAIMMLLAFYLKFDSVEARVCIQAVNHFKKMDYCDYLFDYVRIDNTLIPTKNQYGLNKHYYVEMRGREHIELCDTKENKYLLRMRVDNTKMDRKVYDLICNEVYHYQKLSFAESLQKVVQAFKVYYDNNKNVDYLRLSRLEIAHVLDRANELQNGNEWDLVELLSYLYIQTNISEMYHMEERINVFFTCRLNTDVSKSYTVEKELCVDTMIQSELLSLKSYQVESRVNEKIEDRYVRENPLNQFIEQIH